jgi:hypothetical protein
MDKIIRAGSCILNAEPLKRKLKAVEIILKLPGYSQNSVHIKKPAPKMGPLDLTLPKRLSLGCCF